MTRPRGLSWIWPLLALRFVASSSATSNLSNYDEEEALKFLEFARVSFCDDKPITHWLCGDACGATKSQVVPWGVELIGPGDASGVKGYSAQLVDPSAGQRRCVLAYRGSVNLENWLADAKLMLTDWPPQRAPDEVSPLLLGADPEAEAAVQDKPPAAQWCPGCQVHGGFAEAYEELRNETMASLHKLGCKLIDVTGHSLGAGVATLAAMDLRASGMQVRMLWTFGSPRVGNLAFVKAFMALAEKQGAPVASWRVVHFHDPVPQGGPSDFYMHVPNQVYYPRDSSSFKVCPTVRWEGEKVVHPKCGMYELGYADISGGLLYQDHVNYLNRTLALKNMHSLCVHMNFCTKQGKQYSLVEMVLASVVSCVLGSTLVPMAWQRVSRRRGGKDKGFDEDDEGSDDSTSPSELESK